MNKRYHGNDLVLGTTKDGKKVIWTQEQRRTHLYTSGVTRSGKSRFLQSLLRQDLAQHWKTRQGLLLLDPHGELYDGVLAHIAEHPALWRLPVVLIDLRKDDWITAYNLLKERPGIDPAVVATSFVESITHAFGGANPTETPRLARIARMFIQALFDAKRTLFDVLPLLEHGNSTLREALLADLPESSAREFFGQFNQLGKREFDSTVESFVNRMSSFLSNRVIGHMLGQSAAPSFDFDRAIEDGAIVLVCLATERGKIAESDSRLFASLMLSDLWQVAKLRGKKGAGFTKPFAVYADEFQNFLTYTMSQQLDQAAGFGIQFILAHQFPSQILDHGGDHGAAIYRSVMVNARTKVVFQTAEQPEERAPLVAALFDGAIDVHRLEQHVTSFQTIGYREVRRVLKGGGRAHGRGTSVGVCSSKTTSTARTIAEGGVEGDGEASAQTISRGSAQSIGHVSSSGQVATLSSGTATPELAGLDAVMPVTTIETHGSGTSFGSADIESMSESESESQSTSRNTFRAANWSVARQVGESESESTSATESRSTTSSDSWQEQVTQEPILKERPTQLMSVENQLVEFGQLLSGQAPRHAYVRLPGERLPAAFRALDCHEAVITAAFVERIRLRFIARTNCALLFADASARIAAARAAAIPDTDDSLRIAATARRRAGAAPKERGHA